MPASYRNAADAALSRRLVKYALTHGCSDRAIAASGPVAPNWPDAKLLSVAETVVVQIVWSGPALEVVGEGATVITTSSCVEAHGVRLVVQLQRATDDIGRTRVARLPIAIVQDRDGPHVARRFQAYGLKTELVQDVGRDAMRSAVEKFTAASSGADSP